MKIAVSGKGGSGKSTVAAVLSRMLARDGGRVLSLDCDPDANLASALGFGAEELSRVIPVSRQIALIEERTGAKVRRYGQMFKLNPDVSDVADNHAVTHNGVSLLVLGAAQSGGGGCACPESVFIKALVADLILCKNDALVMDMEAGIEHLGRGTARGVDVMLVIVEPGQNSVDCAKRVIKMTGQIGIKNILLIANKVRSEADEKFIRDSLAGYGFAGVIPFSDAVRESDRPGRSAFDALTPELTAAFESALEKIKSAAAPLGGK
jgi:CO dehydrogenase maturation factor